MIGAGIQVLRSHRFGPETMVRRAAEGAEGGGGGGAEDGGDAELARWSSHRVMQWLKAIDLAEYAPNLRGAGTATLPLLLYSPASFYYHFGRSHSQMYM